MSLFDRGDQLIFLHGLGQGTPWRLPSSRDIAMLGPRAREVTTITGIRRVEGLWRS